MTVFPPEWQLASKMQKVAPTLSHSTDQGSNTGGSISVLREREKERGREGRRGVVTYYNPREQYTPL
jgi:hypothetical protein